MARVLERLGVRNGPTVELGYDSTATSRVADPAIAPPNDHP